MACCILTISGWETSARQCECKFGRASGKQARRVEFCIGYLYKRPSSGEYQKIFVSQSALPASIGSALAPWWSPKLVKLGFTGLLRRMHGRNGLTCGMLIYPDKLQKQFRFGQYWPNFAFLVAKKLDVKLRFPCIPRKCMEGMAQNMSC